MIESIKIKLNKKNAELTLEQAEELYNELHKLFGSKVVNNYPWQYYNNYPLGVRGFDLAGTGKPNPYDITCETKSDNGMSKTTTYKIDLDKINIF